MKKVERVVFDCNVYLQALLSPSGPAGKCVEAAAQGKVIASITDQITNEIRGVALRKKIVQKFQLTKSHVEEFLEHILGYLELATNVPHVFDYERDPDDEHYVDLAVATSSTLIVSRDKDLLDLQDGTNPDGVRFKKRFPGIDILTPSEFLCRIDP